MKIKITNTEDGRKLASCFIGSKLVGFDEDRILVGVDGRYQYPFYVTDLCQYEEITLDLSTSQPCIYQCMKQGLKVEAYFVYGKGGFSGVGTYDLSDIDEQRELLEMKKLGYIKSIKILDLDKMDGVTIEGGEG